MVNSARTVATIVAVVVFSVLAVSLAAEPDSKKKEGGKLRHVVLFKFKDDAPADKVKAIEDAFRALPQKIPEIADFEWGTNVSVENRSEGFTHCFMVTFNNEEGRAVYLPHPAHKAFGQLLRPYIDKILVIDFVPKK